MIRNVLYTIATLSILGYLMDLTLTTALQVGLMAAFLAVVIEVSLIIMKVTRR